MGFANEQQSTRRIVRYIRALGEKRRRMRSRTFLFGEELVGVAGASDARLLRAGRAAGAQGRRVGPVAHGGTGGLRAAGRDAAAVVQLELEVLLEAVRVVAVGQHCADGHKACTPAHCIWRFDRGTCKQLEGTHILDLWIEQKQTKFHDINSHHTKATK